MDDETRFQGHVINQSMFYVVPALAVYITYSLLMILKKENTVCGILEWLAFSIIVPWWIKFEVWKKRKENLSLF